MTDYFIRYESGATSTVISPHTFEYEGMSLFVWERCKDDWQVVETTTGCYLVGDEHNVHKTKDAAINAVKKMIDRYTPASIRTKIKHALETYARPKQQICNIAEA